MTTVDQFLSTQRLQSKKDDIDVTMIDILKTQDLDCSFCVRYILNENYHFLSQDDNITIDDVVKYQPHISKTQLLLGLANYKRADDSVEDFESFALRHP
jgi:hypothetical protein